MTLTIEHVDSLLSAWFEGDLGLAERRAVDLHLRECLRCAKMVRDIEAIRSDAASLPPMEPSRDLWAGIAARIEAPVIELPARQAAFAAPRRRTWQMAAAAVLLMAVSSGVTYLVTNSGQRVDESAAADSTGIHRAGGRYDAWRRGALPADSCSRQAAPPVLVRNEPYAG